MKSKFFEIFNCLNRTQLKEVEFFCDFPDSKLSTSQKKLLKNLIADRKKKLQHTEHSFKKKYWKNKNIAEWNKNKTAFQKIINRYLLSDLRFEDFWGDYVLLNFYIEKQLEKNFNLLWKKLEKKAKSISSKNSKEKIELFLLYELKTSKNKFNRSIKAIDYLSYSEENLDKFYGLQKLRMACEHLNRQKINTILNYEYIDEDIIELLYKKLNNSTEIQIYYNIFHLLKSPKKEGHYNEVNKIINVEYENLHKDMLIEIIDYLMNYCIRNLDNRKYLNGYKLHFEFMDTQKILLENNKIGIHKYNNYVAVCLILNDLQKVENIIERLGKRIYPVEYAKEAKILSELRYHLFKLNTGKCWNLISKIQTYDRFHNFSLEKIYIQLFFLDDKKAFNARLVSVRRKLDKEKTLSKSKRTYFRNFINVLKSINEDKKVDTKKLDSILSPLDYVWLKIVINSKKYCDATITI